MAAVYRDEPSIVILEGIALDIEGMEVKAVSYTHLTLPTILLV